MIEFFVKPHYESAAVFLNIIAKRTEINSTILILYYLPVAVWNYGYCLKPFQLSEAITFTIVQRESGLHHVRKLLEDGEVDVRSSAVSLIRNLSRYHELHPIIGNQMHSWPYRRTLQSKLKAGLILCVCVTKVKQVLPELVEMLPEDDFDDDGGGDTQLPVEVTTSLCHILNNLSQSDKQHVRAIVNEGGLPKIIGISTSGSSDNGSVWQGQRLAFLFGVWRVLFYRDNFSLLFDRLGQNRASQSACVLLHTMWKHTDLRNVYKKVGSYRRRAHTIDSWIFISLFSFRLFSFPLIQFCSFNHVELSNHCHQEAIS